MSFETAALIAIPAIIAIGLAWDFLANRAGTHRCPRCGTRLRNGTVCDCESRD